MSEVFNDDNEAAFGAHITEHFQKGAEMLRELSRSQAEIWQRIPYLALMADGRNGYSADYSHAYNDGLWVVASFPSGSAMVCVDLANGDLVSALNPETQAPDHFVMDFGSDPSRLNAAQVVDRINEKISKPLGAWINPEALRAEQTRKLGYLGLSEVYVRQRSITAEELHRRWARSLGDDMAG